MTLCVPSLPGFFVEEALRELPSRLTWHTDVHLIEVDVRELDSREELEHAIHRKAFQFARSAGREPRADEETSELLEKHAGEKVAPLLVVSRAHLMVGRFGPEQAARATRGLALLPCPTLITSLRQLKSWFLSQPTFDSKLDMRDLPNPTLGEGWREWAEGISPTDVDAAWRASGGVPELFERRALGTSSDAVEDGAREIWINLENLHSELLALGGDTGLDPNSLGAEPLLWSGVAVRESDRIRVRVEAWSKTWQALAEVAAS